MKGQPGKSNPGYKHGHSHRSGWSRTYHAWVNMKNRCFNPKHRQYGIYKKYQYVPWLNFETFLADMGECPPGLMLEREDNTKGYGPTNTVWATRQAQNRNRSSTKLTLLDALYIRAMSYLISPSEVAREYGISIKYVYDIRSSRKWKL